MTHDELEGFVASLKIPPARKTVVLAELADHLACAQQAAAHDGRDPQTATLDLEALRPSLEAIEPAFGVTRIGAFGRGSLASLLVAVAIDRGGPALSGGVGALIVIGLAALLAPPRLLLLLRAEVRAPRVRGLVTSGRPIGPALTYLVTVLSGPFLIWIGLIITRAQAGQLALEVPPSAFAVMVAVHLVL